jgi:hypothetical protein
MPRTRESSTASRKKNTGYSPAQGQELDQRLARRSSRLIYDCIFHVAAFGQSLSKLDIEVNGTERDTHSASARWRFG